MPGGALLVDAPNSCVPALEASGAIERLTTMVVSSDRTRSVEGLIGVAAAARRAGRTRDLTVVHPLTAERPSVLANAWSTGWPEGPGLMLDAVAPGGDIDWVGGVIRLVPLRVGEAVNNGVRPVAGVGVVIDLDGGRVVWVPSSRPGASARRLAHGATLAVMEVGVLPFPRTEHPWRRSLGDALRDASGAADVWLVGDDGRRVGGDVN